MLAHTPMPFEASPQSPTRHKIFGFGKSSRRRDTGANANSRKRKTSFRFKSAFDTKAPSKMQFYSIQVAPEPPVTVPDVAAATAASASATTFDINAVRTASSLTRLQRQAEAPKKHVTFDEAAIIQHRALETGVNPKGLWFNKQELRAMRTRFKDYLYALQTEHKHETMASSKPSTLQIWYRAYHTCTLAKARHVDVYPIKDPNNVGAERLGVSNILHDIANRRRALIIAAQTKTYAEHRAKLCRTISRPSRLYALYVAKASLLLENEA